MCAWYLLEKIVGALTSAMTNNNNKDDNKLLLKVQGADLKRFNKNKKRLHLTTAPLWYNCKKCTLKQACIEIGWVSIPSNLLLYTMHL
jgi:hypothetical protein